MKPLLQVLILNYHGMAMQAFCLPGKAVTRGLRLQRKSPQRYHGLGGRHLIWDHHIISGKHAGNIFCAFLLNGVFSIV